MSTDDQLERRVEQWLAETARPMPPEILDDVLLELPRVARRSWPRIETPWRRLRPALAVGLVAALIVTVGLAGNAIPFLQRWFPAGGSATPGPAAVARVWDPYADFEVGSHAANPSGDAYGNPGVWAYLYGPGTSREPAGYVLMPSFDTSTNRWTVPGFQTLEIYPVSDGTAVELHPFKTGNEGARTAILRWTSPVAAQVSVRARFIVGQTCPVRGDGVIASIDDGATRLWTADVPEGDTASFDSTVVVQPGSTLYFVVEPGIDSNCDTTTLVLRIATP